MTRKRSEAQREVSRRTVKIAVIRRLEAYELRLAEYAALRTTGGLSRRAAALNMGVCEMTSYRYESVLRERGVLPIVHPVVTP